ncbi:phosphate propanoyltransferase [Clostridium carnis]
MGVLNITNKRVKVGVSARHVHLSKEDLDKLFGENYKLNVKKSLMGDQFAAEETVTIIGDKLKAIENVRILGPTRSKTQVEISLTDSIYLGVTAPIRLSGDIEKTAEITIVGPKGVVRKSEGCIVAKRHIHMSTLDSKKLGIKEGVISVKFNGERDGILNNIDVRISDEYHLELHIDTDEANALGIKNGEYVEILS